MEPQIFQAIKEKRVVRFLYGDGIRRVEPYCHAYIDDDEVLLGRQIGGFSGSGDSKVWRLFRVKRMSGISISDERFEGSSQDFNPDNPNPAVTEIHCSVEPRLTEL